MSQRIKPRKGVATIRKGIGIVGSESLLTSSIKVNWRGRVNKRNGGGARQPLPSSS